MPRAQSVAIQERNQDIVKTYQNGSTISELCHHYGLSKSAVKKILKDRGVQLRREPRAFAERRILSGFHTRLGLLVSHHRHFVVMLGRQQASHILNISESRLTLLEQGLYDPTFSELMKIATWMDISIDEMLGRIVSSEPILTRR